jgi:hypothetical protein
MVVVVEWTPAVKGQLSNGACPQARGLRCHATAVTDGGFAKLLADENEWLTT